MATMQRIGKVATTVARDEKGTLRVTYHSTVVVRVDADGVITLDHGGWMTATTKTRMNQTANEHGLGFQVWQKAGHWFVTYRGKDHAFDSSPLVLKK